MIPPIVQYVLLNNINYIFKKNTMIKRINIRKLLRHINITAIQMFPKINVVCSF